MLPIMAKAEASHAEYAPWGVTPAFETLLIRRIDTTSPNTAGFSGRRASVKTRANACLEATAVEVPRQYMMDIPNPARSPGTP